jgi:predicted pyridoxine 5'-phosphate oxidase superfamily flavin-nucleotide-binding protein
MHWPHPLQVEEDSRPFLLLLQNHYHEFLQLTSFWILSAVDETCIPKPARWKAIISESKEEKEKECL